MFPSTSFYGCGDKRFRQKYCILEPLGGCSDHQAPDICNKHASIFGLYYSRNDFVSANRDHAVKVETYVCSQNNLRISLFTDEHGTTLMDEIMQFSKYTEENFKSYGINSIKLAEIIGSLVGLTAFIIPSDCNTRSWLNNKDALIFRYANDNVYMHEARKLPTLHKMLFAHCYSSIESNDTSEKFKVRLDSLIMTLDPTTNRYIFTTTNNDMVMKKTNHINCIATPLVLSGYNKLPSTKEAQTFQSSHNYADHCMV